MSKKPLTLGEELVSAVEEALADKEAGRVVRPDIDLVGMRKKLKLTQKQFAEQYHVNLETLRNWEQHKRSLDTTSLAYLTCIAKRPRLISQLLNAA